MLVEVALLVVVDDERLEEEVLLVVEALHTVAAVASKVVVVAKEGVAACVVEEASWVAVVLALPVEELRTRLVRHPTLPWVVVRQLALVVGVVGPSLLRRRREEVVEPCRPIVMLAVVPLLGVSELPVCWILKNHEDSF